MNAEPPSARSTRRSASLQILLNLVLAAVILVLANYLGFKHYDHKDLSASQYYVLSDKTKAVLRNLDSPVKIYTFLNEQATLQDQQIENLLKEYQLVGGKNLSFEKIDPAYDMKRAVDLQKQLHFENNDHLIILTYKDRSPRFVKQEDLFDTNQMTGQVGAFKGEQQLTAAILALVEGKASKVYFTEGHGEHSIHDLSNGAGYGTVAALLKNDNVEMGTINLGQKGEVPDDADAVIIAGPSVAFAPMEADALDHYLARNGKLLVLLDPFSQLGAGVDAVLQKYGLKYEDDLVLYRISTATGGQLTMPLAVIYQGGFAAQPITAKFAQANLQLIIQNARSITLPQPNTPPATKVEFLLQTDADAWGWISKGGATPPDPRNLIYNKVTDLPGPVTIAAQYDGGMTTDPATKATMYATRVVAVGCSAFLENDAVTDQAANFFTNAVDWLVKKDAVFDIAPKKPTQYGVSLSPMSFNAVAWTAVVVVPGLALLAGFATWLSRRK